MEQRVGWLWPSAVLGSIFDPWGDKDYPSYQVPMLYTVDPEGFKFVNDPPNLDECIADSLKAVWPGIKAGLQSINSIYELKDFKTLPKTILAINRGTKALTSLLKRSGRKNFGRKPLRAILHGIADGHLTMAFAISPLLSDLQALDAQIRNLRKKIDKLLKEEGKLKSSYFTLDISSQYLNTKVLYPVKISANDAGINWATRTVSDTATFNAVLRYSYTLRDLERQSATMRGLLDGFGVNFDPKYVWDAIPWSFVVDWVAGVGQWLSNNFSKQMLEPVVTIQEYSWSIKVDRWTHCSMSMNFTNQHISAREYPRTSIHERAYKRVPLDQLSLYRPLKTSGISLREFFLSSSLAYTRKRPGRGGAR